ncbi:RNA polymerase II transcription elongation factor SpEAF [Schizosaccharomyces pombe]
MNSLQKGSYKVIPGSSFSKNSNGLLSIKYNFIPESVDPSRRGVLEKAQEAYRLRLPSTFDDDRPHIFEGSCQRARNVDCVLIFNAKTKTFTLEHIDEIARLNALRNPKVSKTVPSNAITQSDNSQISESKSTSQSAVTTNSTRRKEKELEASKDGKIKPSSSNTRYPAMSSKGPITTDTNDEPDMEVMELDDFAKELELGFDQEFNSIDDSSTVSQTASKPISLRGLSSQERDYASSAQAEGISSASEDED